MISLSHYILVHSFIPMPQGNENTRCKSSKWRKNSKIRAWQLKKVRNKNEVIAEARKKSKTVHCASLMDLCHLKNSELQFQKCKGRVVLRGDIVKDDSGSCAVFTEQGSSASRMTAAKVMGIISRLPGCAEQAADAVSAYGQNHGPVWKIQSFLLSAICTVVLEQDCYGKGNSGKFCENTDGKKFHIGNACSLTEKRDNSCLCMWTL